MEIMECFTITGYFIAVRTFSPCLFQVIVMAILVAILFRKPLDGECPNVDLDAIKAAAERRQQNSSRMYLS